MKILVHACCGPCAVVPLRRLREEGGTEVFAVFANSNIHPYQEWDRRRQALEDLAERTGVRLLPHAAYEPVEWFRSVAFREAERCRLCYYQRLRHTASLARRGRFDAFTTTLLYSRYQKHDLIRAAGEAVAAETGVPFSYSDWRPDWDEGVAESRAMGLYRQSYCGCLYSEVERYAPRGKTPA